MYWDIADAGTSNGAKLCRYHYTGEASQTWNITTDSDGYSTIINAYSGKALDVQGGTVSDAKQLQQYTPNGSKAQKWRFKESDGGYRVVSALDETYAIKLSGTVAVDGAAITLFTDQGGRNQRWNFEKVADQTSETSDITALFDTSVYITNTQPGTITWESIPSGWAEDTLSYYYWVTKAQREMHGISYTASEYYPWGNDVIKARIDKCCKVNGKWASIRLTFSNINSTGVNWYSLAANRGKNVDATSTTSIGFTDDNIWAGIWMFAVDTLDMNVELFYTDTGETISLEGAWYTAASLNYFPSYTVSKVDTSGRTESCKYLTDNNFDSYTINGTGVKQKADGSWYGSEDLLDNSTWDVIGSEEFPRGSVAFQIVDEKPTFKLANCETLRRGMNVFNLSPLTIATPPSPSKNVLITG